MSTRNNLGLIGIFVKRIVCLAAVAVVAADSFVAAAAVLEVAVAAPQVVDKDWRNICLRDFFLRGIP